MTASHRSFSTVIRLMVIAGGLCAALLPAATAHAQVGPCALLPGRPENSPTEQALIGPAKGSICMGLYWGRTDVNANNAQRFDIQVQILLYEDQAEAVKRLTGGPEYRPVAYGNGGFERLEDARAQPRGTRVSAAVLTGEVWTGNYLASFRCGQYLVYVSADPSKGVEARRMMSEMNDRMSSESLCGGVPATPPPPVPPTQTTTTPPPPPSAPARGVFSVAGDCLRSGQSLLCTANALNPPDNVPLGQIRFLWALDGAVQGSRSNTLNVPQLAPGPHVVGVRAFTPDTMYTETFLIQVR